MGTGTLTSATGCPLRVLWIVPADAHKPPPKFTGQQIQAAYRAAHVQCGRSVLPLITKVPYDSIAISARFICPQRRTVANNQETFQLVVS